MRRFIREGEDFRHFPHHDRARIPKPLVLAAFFGYFLSLVTESTPAGGIYRQKGCAGRNPPVTAFLWPWGRELRIATGAARPRNDRGFCKGHGRAGGQGRPPLQPYTFVGQGPCALPGVREKNPPVTAFPWPWGRGGGLPRALRTPAMTEVLQGVRVHY